MYCLEKLARLVFEKSIVSSVDQTLKQDHLTLIQKGETVPPISHLWPKILHP